MLRSFACSLHARWIATTLVLAAFVSTGLVGCSMTDSGRRTTTHSIDAQHGMVVAAEPLAAAAGIAMLERGGNAIDAAVATGFALAVTYPAAGNLGGGGFLVATLPDSDTRIALDFREIAPARADRDLYVRARESGREDASTLGHLAVGVPGSVAGLLYALDKWGSLDRSVVMQPAIDLARDGFAMPARTHAMLAAQHNAERMQRFAETARIFYPNGEPIAAGQLFKQPDLASTLARIRDEGVTGFYRGECARAITDEMRRHGGLITLADLDAYRAVERSPIEFEFRGLTIVTMPPPSSGGVCLEQMLGMLERTPLATLAHNSPASLHLLAEAMRRSFADRNRYLGDPDFGDLPLARLRSHDYIESLAASIDRNAATPSATLLGDTLVPKESRQTTHYSVVDRFGGAAAVTTTLNGAFGCKVVVPGTGMLLNNEMDDFASEPGKPNLYGLIQGETNAVGPGRRPLSSMTPTIALDGEGRARYVLGSPGGPTIITNVLQVLLNLTVFAFNAASAIDAPKIHHQCLPDRIDVEPEISEDVRNALRALGHKVNERGWIGDFQLIVRQADGTLTGASDARGGGEAVGY